MRVYDFDDTIYHSNSLRRFFGFCLLRFPYLVLVMPTQLFAYILNKCGVMSKERSLTVLEWFLYLVPNVKKQVNKFWNKEFCRIKQWYLQQKEPTDVVISATPSLIIGEVCNRLGVSYIATEKGIHCYGHNKVTLFKQRFGNVIPQEFYSDSLSDYPMLKYAEKGFVVQGEKVTLYYDNGVSVVDIDENKLQRKYK